MTHINVNFSEITGTIRPVHGMNNCARSSHWGDLLPEYKALNVPISRLHDTCGAYGGSHYVDVPNIFPDFSADPDDPASYDFTLTDHYLKYLVESGCDVMYRLGVTIEHAPKKYQIFAPSDPHKWADICEHIVRHYNDGWAEGYHFGIKYWEIWNEPDGIDPYIEPHGQPMWIGTAEQYYELYSITANLLKAKHPDIRVGGYSSCKVDGTFRDGRWQTGPIEYLENFLTWITAPETHAPLDFFSWHAYLGYGGMFYLDKLGQFTKDILARYGFTETENFNTEWNVYLCQDKVERLVLMRNEMGASHCAASLCTMQNGGFVDKAMYYDSQYGAHYGALYHFPSCKPTKTFHAFRLFGELFALRNACRVENDCPTVYTTAAVSEGEGAVMLCNPTATEIPVALTIAGIESREILCCLLDATHDGEEQPIAAAECESLTLQPYSVTLIRVK